MLIKPNFKLNQIALLVMFTLTGAGCANMGGPSGEHNAGSIRPVEKTVHSVDESKAQYLLGKYYLGQNRTGLALVAFTKAVRHNPLNAEARNARAIALVKIGDFQAAITELETAIATNPDQAYLHNNLAYAYMLNGSLILAAENLQLALQMEPRNPRARENWRELSEKAASNPRLAERLAGMLPPLPAEEPVQDATSTPDKITEPGSANLLDSPAPTSVAVLNVDFEFGLLPATRFDSSPVTPLAANSIGITNQPPSMESGSLPPLKVNIVAMEPATRRLGIMASIGQHSTVWNGTAPIAFDVRDMSIRDNATLVAAATDHALSVGPIQFGEPMATDVLTRVAPVDDVIAMTSVFLKPDEPPMAVDVREMISLASPPGNPPGDAWAQPLPVDSSYDLSTVLVEVSNGNGIDRIANVLSKALKVHKVRVWRITNAEHFDNDATEVHYVKGHRNEALALASMLPGNVAVIQASGPLKDTQIRIIVGRSIKSLKEVREVLAPTTTLRKASA